MIKHGQHIFFEKFTRCAKVCGLLFLDCDLRVLIGWAGKLQSDIDKKATEKDDEKGKEEKRCEQKLVNRKLEKAVGQIL